MNESAATSAERNSFCAMIIIIVIKVHMRECSSGCGGGCSAVLLAGERQFSHSPFKFKVDKYKRSNRKERPTHRETK